MIIYYYDNNLDETFMTIFRSSRLCFYLSVDNQKKTFRTQKEIVEYLDTFFTEHGEWLDYIKYIRSSKMLENRFYHSKFEVRKKDYAEWLNKRKKEIYYDN